MTIESDLAALSAHSVSVSLGNAWVLQGVCATFAPGRWTCIAGPNGAGKSSLLKALAGLLPFEGHVQLLGKPLAAWPRQERAQRLCWMGQNETSASDLRVWDVVMLGRLPHQAWLSSASSQDQAVVEQALRETQAWDWRSRALGELSGGERQRVLLARALAVQARVLLMDEPLASLDPPHQADWLAIVRGLVAQGITVVSVLHDISMALLADDLLILQAGRVLHQGACADAATHRALEQVFEQRIRVVQVQDHIGGAWIALPRL